ncbi:SUMO-specific isopeptidase USPL1 [Clinocottus analis]|uniref:SUMO-specific isopeptidase USPL1 n=1 Tax=Clinocottus analis TaxID=304258 RepID=UPI0035C1F9CF
MVIFFEWYWKPVDQRSSSGLPMTGEDTGLGALASPLVGYLGKVQERAASLEYCPWCTSKGLTYALRSYRINLQDSVTLCTNSQCLFPLVSRSLEDVLASLHPVETSVKNKRKNALALEKEELITPGHKRLRSSNSLGPQSFTETLVTPAEHGALNIVNNGHHAAPKTEEGKVNGYRDLPVAGTAGWKSLHYEGDVLVKEPESAVCADGIAPPTCLTPAGHLQCSSEALLITDGDAPSLSPHRCAPGVSEAEDDCRQVKSSHEVLNRCCNLDYNQSFFKSEDIFSTEINTPLPSYNEQTGRTEQKSPTADITACKDIGDIKSELDGLSSSLLTKSEELVSVQNQPFWRNSDNLCWLDSLLVALVNCKSLRKCKPKEEPLQSSVWQLMGEYEDVCASIQVHQQTGRDGAVRVPNHVLQKADADLHCLRMSVFKLLQPKLHCKLGQRETPVFAMPLLLASDSWVEPLFKSTFHWEFKCSECKTATKERVMKTLPTFTNVLPDWRPLDAVHMAPCNVCCQKDQRRTMKLESVPPVFALHFVEGLPDNDVRAYAFTFKEKRYSITTVIQYGHQLQHFVTWICNSDGSWLEYDDLKHPECRTHQKLLVPAQEMHVVFWEGKEVEEPRVCSPSSTFTESPPSDNVMTPNQGDEDLTADKLFSCSPDQSLLMSHNVTDLVCALSLSEDDSSIMDTTVAAEVDTSIGSATLLDAFEGLSQDDIITLTLVELKVDSEMQPLNDKKETQDVSVPTRNEIQDFTPDSSSAVIGSEISHDTEISHDAEISHDTEISHDAKVSHDAELSNDADVDLHTATSSDSADGSASDPTFVPAARKGRGRRVGRQRVKKAPTKATPAALGVISSKPETTAVAQDNTPPVESAQQPSPVSSTDASPSSDGPKGPPQNARWSFMLSKHPLNQVHKTITRLDPIETGTSLKPVKPTPLTQSTPNPVRRPQNPKGFFPKPQLKTEDSGGLPLKAAEMYDGFGAKSSNTQSPLPCPVVLNGKPTLFEPITSNQQTSLKNTAVVSGSVPPLLGAKRLLEISHLKKQSSHSSKLPPGLSDTEALRYKLIKKLKAKKKKLAKLNEMLGHQGGASLRPDSTGLSSPHTVTSSTYDGSLCDDFLTGLLSPATTASNLSPDSTGFLEMLANGQDRADQVDCGQVNAVGAVCQTNAPNTENFLEEFLSQAVAQGPTELETEALSALELFV